MRKLLILLALFCVSTQETNASGYAEEEDLLDHCLERIDPLKDSVYEIQAILSPPEWLGKVPCASLIPPQPQDDNFTIDEFNQLWVSNNGMFSVTDAVDDFLIYKVRDDKKMFLPVSPSVQMDIEEEHKKKANQFVDFISGFDMTAEDLAPLFEYGLDKESWLLPTTYGMLNKCGSLDEQLKIDIKELISKQNFLVFRQVGYTEAQVSLIEIGHNQLDLQKQSFAYSCKIVAEAVREKILFLSEKLHRNALQMSKIYHKCGDLRSIRRFTKGRMLSLYNIQNNPKKTQQDQEDKDCEAYYEGQLNKLNDNIVPLIDAHLKKQGAK